MTRKVERDAKGRYVKGSSGNRLGRPTRPRREKMPDEVRRDFLDLASSKIAIVEGGRRKTVTISQAIDRQLVQLALKGNRVAVQLFKQREERSAVEGLAELAELADELSKLEKRMRETPDDVDDRLVEIATQARLRLKRFGL
jgi:hypothetical protein